MVQCSGMKLERVIPDVAMIRKVWACEIFSCEAPGLAAVPLTPVVRVILSSSLDGHV
jgi:hypothetical protein